MNLQTRGRSVAQVFLRFPLFWLAVALSALLIFCVSCTGKKATAQAAEASPSPGGTSNLTEAFRDELKRGKDTMDRAKALKNERAAAVAQDEKVMDGAVPATSGTNGAAVATPSATPVDLRAWYAQLQQRYKALDLSNGDAIAAYNTEVRRYHDAVAAQPRKRAQDSLKPLDDGLRPLSKELSPLQDKLKPLPGR